MSDTHGCAITAEGEIVCWGSNEYGQQDIADGPYSAVAAARNYTCAITAEGALRCSGLLTLTNRGEHAWASVSASTEYVCAVDSAGGGACWPKDTGLYDDTGQLEVPRDTRFRQIAGALNLACGITLSNEIACWGSWTSKAIPRCHSIECAERNILGHRHGFGPRLRCAHIRRVGLLGSQPVRPNRRSHRQVHLGERRLGAQLRAKD